MYQSGIEATGASSAVLDAQTTGAGEVQDRSEVAAGQQDPAPPVQEAGKGGLVDKAV